MKDDFAFAITKNILQCICAVFFSFSALALLNDAAGNRFAGVLPWFFVLLVLNSVLMSLLMALFRRERTQVAGFVRLFIIYALVVLCAGRGLDFVLKQKIFFLLLMPLSVLEFVLIYFVSLCFAHYKKVCLQCADKNGKELSEDLYADNANVVDYSQQKKKTVVFLTVFLCLFCAVMIVLKIVLNGASLVSRISILLYAVCYALFLIIFSVFDKEIFYVFLGFKDIFLLRRKKLFFAILILAVAILLAFPVSSDTSLFSFGAVIRFVHRLFSGHKAVVVHPEYTDQDLWANPFEVQGIPQFEGEDTELPFWNVLWTLFEYSLIVLVICGFAVFMFRPFFENKWKIFWQQGKLKTFFNDLWNNIKRFFADLFTLQQKHSSVYSKVEKKDFLDSIAEFLKNTKKSAEKKQELDRLTKEFMRIIEAGTIAGFTYTKNLAPLEYAKKLNLACAQEAGILFEKSLYSNELLTADEEKLFIQKVAESVSEIQKKVVF